MEGVSIGHFVIPLEAAQRCNKNSKTEAAHEPNAKRPRLDTADNNCQPVDKSEHIETNSVPNDVVTVTELSVESLRVALRRYALSSLTRDGVSNTNSSAGKAVRDAIEKWSREAPSQWPVVVPPKPLSPSASWVTWSFCFVPQVLDRKDNFSHADASSYNIELQKNNDRNGNWLKASASEAHNINDTSHLLVADETARKALAAIPLPRNVKILNSSGSAASGCLTAVLSERVALQENSRSVSTSHIIEKPLCRFPSNLSKELTSKPLLLVGAGGIGCELLKVLVLSGFTHIHLIDLDTVDETNLNRQFLFQLQDVGHSKAETACRVVLKWFSADPKAEATPSTDVHRLTPQIVAYHDNIKSECFGDAFYHQFAVVLNALDNVAARQHVNRLCMRNNVPLIESGTMGYNGQVQPIVKGVSECYDCRPKPPDTKTFAVCTIHARPTTMVHCVHYAKELYEVLFGSTSGDESTSSNSVTAVASGSPQSTVEEGDSEEQTKESSQRHDSGGELAYLRALVSAWRVEDDRQQQQHGNYAKRAQSAAQLGAQLLRQLFVDKIEELLSLKSSWPTEPPAPLDRAEVERVVAAHTQALASSQGTPLNPLPTDEVLSLSDSMELFGRAVGECLARPPGVAFKKEDDTSVRFVSATANLRAHVFHIKEQSLEEVRSIAGSIVPAIATTNAIIAAAVVHELVVLLRSVSEAKKNGDKVLQGDVPLQQEAVDFSALHVVYARKAPQARRRRLPVMGGPHHLSSSLYSTMFTPPSTSSVKKVRPRSVIDAYVVHSACLNPPNALHCLVCQDVHPEVVVQLNLEAVTLRQLVHAVLEDALHLEGPSVSHGATLLYEDEDYEALADNTLAALLQAPVDAAEVEEEKNETSTRSSEPHRFVLTADGLNKEVAWIVVLIHAPSTSSNRTADMKSTMTSAEKEEGGEERVGVEFTLSGLEGARVAEQHALARLSEQRRLQAEEEGKGATTAHHHSESLVDSSAQPDTAEIVISEDDDDDVSDVTEVVEGSIAALRSTAVQGAGMGVGVDGLLVLDD